MPDLTRTPPHTEECPFARHLEQAVGGLRSSLTELIVSVGADPGAPLRLARQLGVNKNLTWKAAKIVASEDAPSAVAHVPGAAGFDILLRAFEQAGADEEALREAAEARRAYDRMLQLHAGDRAMLELMVSSSFPGGAEDPLQEASRKQAFLGNSSTWGVQAKVRFGAHFAAPSNVRGGFLDVAAIGGLREFRRLRSTARWPLSFNVRDATPDSGESAPIEEQLEGRDGPAFLLEHCSQPLPEIRSVVTAQGTVYELCAGPVGNTAAFSCAFGWFVRGWESAFAEHDDDEVGFVIPLNTPVEAMTMDVFLHRDLYPDQTPEVVIHSRMELGRGFPPVPDEPFVLPFPVALRELGAGPPAVANPSVPGYRKMVQQVCERLDWRLEDFRGYRLSMRYPPIPTDPVVRMRKPRRAAGA